MSKQYRCIKEYPFGPPIGTITRYDDTERDLRIPESYPEFWELIKEKEWEVISIIPTNLSLVDKNHVIKNGINELQIKLVINTGKWRIHSIKRLFDNEIFTLGDKIQIKGSYQEAKEILSFSEDEYGCYINGVALSRIEKVIPKALFITEDGVAIFKGDDYWQVTPEFRHYFIGNNDYERRSCDKYFSTEKAAKDYIHLNKPKYSLQDIFNAKAEGSKFPTHFAIDFDKLKK